MKSRQIIGKIRKLTAAVLIAAAVFWISGCGRTEVPLQREEFSPAYRAVFFSYLDWNRLLYGKSESEFTESIHVFLKNMQKSGLNRVILQVRAFGDAYYKSELFPMAEGFSGKFDPLAVWAAEAESCGIAVEGWINPFRLSGKIRGEKMTALYQAGEIRAAEDGRYWLNPASAEVRELICAGVREVCRYRVAGIQFDDYFYSGLSPAEFGSTEAEAKAALTGLITAVHDVTEEAGIPFGISPQGRISEELVPASDEILYTSLREWCRLGAVDLLIPQVYYGFRHETAPFEVMAGRWNCLVQGSRCRLVFGLAGYKCGKEDIYAGKGRHEWEEDGEMIRRQILCTLDYSDGFALFGAHPGKSPVLMHG